MKYEITRAADMPGFKHKITIEAGAVWFPDVGKPDGEEKELRAYFNGFELVLKEGDEIKQVD